MYEVADQATERVVSTCVGQFLDQAVDLTARFLTDRADLSASAVFALNRISREGPLRLTTLAAKEGVSQPSMTQLINRLKGHDLVTSLADPGDGRATLIGITQHGLDVIDERRQLRRERLTELLTTLSSEEEHVLWLAAQVAFPILQRLAANAEDASESDVAEADQIDEGN